MDFFLTDNLRDDLTPDDPRKTQKRLKRRGQNMTHPNPQSGRDGWLASFMKELVTMPRRHMIAFFITATLLVLLEVELTEGWHVVHILEVLGALVFLYLLWTAWRAGRS